MKSPNKYWHESAYWMLLCLTVATVYAFGLRNGLVFDDARLTDGTVYGGYGNLLQFKQRILSYGSFVWVQTLAGEGVPVQRAVNLLLHLVTCWALYRLSALLLPRIAYDDATRDDPEFASSQLAALRVGILFFALNPVATYAVGYLIQRSIVMATLFCVLACWAFVRALIERKPAWHGVALLCYVLAVLSKEHAFLLAGLSLPLYVFLVRPRWQRALAMLALATGLLGAVLAVLLKLNPDLLGQLFDNTSRQLATQLDKQRPGALAQIYPLSLLNEAGLFFYYGLLWFLPLPGWMSIDMHPPFPLTLTAMPHVLGLVAYVALLVVSVVALLRRSDVWGFVGLCVLFPLVLFWTEFSTVWVQDPFVLYRSYLWAIPVPALVTVLLTGWAPGTLYKAGIVMVLALSILSTERMKTLESDLSVWTDVIRKTEIPGRANAVGRSRAFLYRGVYYLRNLELNQALQDLSTAQAMGAYGGVALFEMAVTKQVMQSHPDALELLQQAEVAGFKDNVLHFHRAQSRYAMGQFDKALDSYTAALARPLKEPMLTQSQWGRAESALRLRRFAEAESDFNRLLARLPKQPRYLMGLGLSRVGMGNGNGALDTFNQLMTVKPDASAFYGRALANSTLGNRLEAEQDIAKAVQMEPTNALYKQAQASLKSGEKLSL